jgi:SAM-dependent methyltransferase
MKNGGFKSEKDAMSGEPSMLVRRFYNLVKNGMALDLNSGNGNDAVFLAEQGFEVISLDSRQENLEKAIKHARRKDVSIDFRNQDPPGFKIHKGRYSLIIADNVLHHMKKSGLEKFAQEIINGLKKGGILIGSSLSIDDPLFRELRKKHVPEIEDNCFMLVDGLIFSFFGRREMLDIFPELKILHYAETDVYQSGQWRGLVEFVFKKI